MHILSTFERLFRLSKFLLCIVFIGVVGLCDFATGHEYAVSVFYVIPVFYAAWILSLQVAIIASAASSCLWLWLDLLSRPPYLDPWIPFWNLIIWLSFFVGISLISARLRNTLEREKQFARLDGLTGAVNPRLFSELLRLEIERLRRYNREFALAYIDLDNFKAVNDQHGHLIGNQALCLVVNFAKNNLRIIDVFARLGGDEFALLLPETNRKSAEITMTKLHRGLLEQMRQNHWPITFSIGVVVCDVPPIGTDELLRAADKVLYTVKNEGKNAIRYTTYSG